MPVLEVPGASLYYEVHGKGPWLVFAHGAGGNHLTWWQQVPAFSDRFRCLVFSHRGWARSPCRDTPDPARFAGDLTALLDHVGADRAALVGQSMGGWTVYGCALENPERVTRLVLTSTLAGLTDDDMIARLLALHDPNAPLDSRKALAPDFPDRDPDRTFLFSQITELNPPIAPEFLSSLIALRYPADTARLRMPILLLAGGRDQLFPIDLQKQALAKLPTARFAVVEAAGHSIYFECPEAFNRLVGEFLEEETG
jgi:3-oxoadipate enol-lactonase